MTKRELISGPVTSVAQGTRLLELGATAVSVRVDLKDRTSLELYDRLLRAVGNNRLGVIIPAEDHDALPALSSPPAFVEVGAHHTSKSSILNAFEATRSTRMLGDLWLDYDEDPAWTYQSIDRLGLDDITAVVTLIPGTPEPFRYLRHEAGAHEEDVLMSDVLELCASRTVFLSADWSASDSQEWFLDQLPDSTGLTVYIEGGPRVPSSGRKFVTMSEAASFVSKLKQGT